MGNKTWGMILKAPAVLLLAAAFFGGLYAAVKGIGGVGYATPVTIGIIVVLYFVGEAVGRKSDTIGARTMNRADFGALMGK